MAERLIVKHPETGTELHVGWFRDSQGRVIGTAADHQTGRGQVGPVRESVIVSADAAEANRWLVDQTVSWVRLVVEPQVPST